MKEFSESFKEHTMKIINFEKKEMIPSTNQQQKLCEKIKIDHTCKKSSNINTLMVKIVIIKLKTIAIILVNTEMLHIAYLI